ncbi:MAG: hypothetical protein Q4A12_02780 [Eubacteriales bacterium]|nr:hypothetical protein [Eubacteriales bacterium]
MGQYRISDLNIEVDTNSKTLIRNLAPYEVEFDYKPNLSLSITDDILLQLMDEYEGYTSDIIECEYISTEFARALFDFNGFPMKATAVEHDGSAVIFASPFTDVDVNMYLPSDKIFAYNDVAVRLISSLFYAYGTPFGLKGDLSTEKKLPIKSIVYVDNERFDSLKRLDTKDMVSMFIRSVMLAIRSERTKHTLFMLEKLMKVVDFYGVSDLNDIDFILEKVTE